jgi:hypothetical protein
MVQIIGPLGASWEKITKEEKDLDYNVVPISANAEAQANEMKAKKRLDALTLVVSNPILIPVLNPKKTVEEILRFGEFDDEAIKTFLDTQNYGSEEVLAEAGMAIKIILEGGKPRPCLDATTGFVQKIINFAKSNDLKPDTFQALMIYAEQHIPIAEENAGRAAVMDNPMPPNPTPDANQPRTMPATGAPAASAIPSNPSNPGAPAPLAPNGPAL